MITERWSAEWRRVGGSTSRPRYRGRAQLRREGETGTALWRGDGTGRLKGRRQETYDIIEIGLIIDAGEPGRIGGARMGKRDGSDDQKHQQHGAYAIGTRSVQAIENSHSRLVESRSVSGAPLWGWKRRLSRRFVQSDGFDSSDGPQDG